MTKKTDIAINFRFLGDTALRQPMLDRMAEQTTATATAVARESLVRYFTILDRELRSLNFSRGEVMLLLDVKNGWMATTESIPYLAMEVEEALQDGLAEKWSVDGPALVTRLKGLSTGARFALVDALERAWDALGEHEDIGRAAVAVGLLRDEAGRGL